MSEVWAAHRLLFARKEVAKLLSISTRQLTRLIDNGKIDVVRVGSRTLIHKDEVEKFSRNGAHFMKNPRPICRR